MARIVIAGAGAIGCFVGGLLAASGAPVSLWGRARILDPIRRDGLRLSDFGGLDLSVGEEWLQLSEDAAVLSDAAVVLVCVKSAATESIAAEIAARAPEAAPVISLQNGIDNADRLRRLLPGRDVRAGMVPFNVVPRGPAHWHRATSGDIVLEAGPGDLAARLSVPGLTLRGSRDIAAVQWGKLLLNLTNALNALSGLTLRDQLLDRDWRRLIADQMAEALAVLRAAGIRVAPPTPAPARLLPHLLRLPTPLFTRIAAQMLTIDPAARTSMAYDLEAGRGTEIDQLQGAIVALVARGGPPAPICAAVAERLQRAVAEGQRRPHLGPDQIRP
ncbi:2-dehydropantoate 2-reductase [Pseudodonghicola flavimaris]|uniref:2-dehydropantoate 2-reductase n=1 Tax=Pseudodonghicola flavimaris TaxID=3050036 RepID=A0ABT7EZ35_9RHOB|nr:2-dehydropantoate 2-reductase [Pseudodonghicola flavimaris]MDK3017519.1 2-dehydropantoate 2-reductase [Pseudodonghicola flavimaris]